VSVRAIPLLLYPGNCPPFSYASKAIISGGNSARTLGSIYIEGSFYVGERCLGCLG